MSEQLALPARHCAACGAATPPGTRARTSECCGAPWCNGAGRARYCPSGAPMWDTSRQFAACCDAGAAWQRPAGEPIPRRVAAW